jgi:hypothetical protein
MFKRIFNVKVLHCHTTTSDYCIVKRLRSSENKSQSVYYINHTTGFGPFEHHHVCMNKANKYKMIIPNNKMIINAINTESINVFFSLLDINLFYRIIKLCFMTLQELQYHMENGIKK